MATRIRYRTDSIIIAEGKAKGNNYEDSPEWFGDKAEFDRTPAAEPGDVWPLHWYRNEGEGPLAGYAICCPKCKEVHHWSTANNCSSKRPLTGGGFTCDHSGNSSCWQWSGSPEEGTMSASPSLGAGCGWHGWLRNGVLEEC